MADLLVDTDIFVDHLRGARAFRPGDHTVWYSVVTRAELFAGNGAEEGRVATILAPFREVVVTREVAQRAGRIRRVSSTAMADALIAATAIERGLRLLTRNRRHFEGIDGLDLLEGPDLTG